MYRRHDVHLVAIAVLVTGRVHSRWRWLAGVLPAVVPAVVALSRTACTNRVDVDALLIRPDGCVAWALPTGQDLDATTVVRALGAWFGHPARAPH